MPLPETWRLRAPELVETAPSRSDEAVWLENMPSLILEFKQGEAMILNGAVIRFKTRARLELNSHARFLFGKQVMEPQEATTPARRVYYALQQAYTGPEALREEHFARARQMIAALCESAPGTVSEFSAGTPPGTAQEAVKQETINRETANQETMKMSWAVLLGLAGEATVLAALKCARQIIRAEEGLPPQRRERPAASL